jgi:hydrogenase maturation factor
VTEKLDPAALPEAEDSAESDLARRLARYRRRVEAEGRPRSLKLIDRAIEDADRKARGPA